MELAAKKITSICCGNSFSNTTDRGFAKEKDKETGRISVGKNYCILGMSNKGACINKSCYPGNAMFFLQME